MLTPLLARNCVRGGPPGARSNAETRADERGRRLVGALTLDQKISQLHGEQQPQDYRIVPGIPDLCVPDLTVANGPAGVGASTERLNGPPATALPAPIALASTWDPAMAQTFGQVLGAEMLQTGRNWSERRPLTPP